MLLSVDHSKAAGPFSESEGFVDLPKDKDLNTEPKDLRKNFDPDQRHHRQFDRCALMQKLARWRADPRAPLCQMRLLIARKVRSLHRIDPQILLGKR